MKTVPTATWVVLGIFVAGASAQAQQMPGGYGPMWGGGWSGWFFGPLMMIAMIALAVVVVVLLVRWLGGTGATPGIAPPPPARGKTPVEILKERFARGEIDEEEYARRRRVLED